MKFARILAPFALALLACTSNTANEQQSSSSSSSGGNGTPDPDRGISGDGDTSAAAAASDKNPDGVPYPTDNLGTTARIGKNPGNRIANYKFLAYPDGDMSKGLQPVSLANYFDPEGKKYTMIHIQASGSWCVHCQRETETVTPLKAKLDQRKVVWLMSLAEGPVGGTPATKSDLDKWMNNYKHPYTQMWDPGNKNLGLFYDAAALPWNADIHAKSMEIIHAGVGAVESEADLLEEVDKQLALIATIK